MRVLIVSTSERAGGAAVAASRLMDALNNNGEKAKMLVRDKESDRITVVKLRYSLLQRWRFLWERWCIFIRMYFSRKNLFQVDIANSGADITSMREFKEADIIHLHWINQGMLSLRSIEKILRSGKPVVWTMHDMWPATAICHLTLGCSRYKVQCKHCKYLPGGGGENDMAARVWQRKKRVLRRKNICFVACSRWLEREARSSALLLGQSVTSIPNPIDTHLFAPGDKREARRRFELPQDKKLILFVAQRATNPNKGVSYLVEACRVIGRILPDLAENMGLVVMGTGADELEPLFDIPVYSLGYSSDHQFVLNAYHAADAFVLPSLSENLPNTIMEAMACGVPCVGFDVGGIPEMIDHQKNGYVAQLKDANDLADGIAWVLDESRRDELRRESVKKVMASYSQRSVSLKYMEVYHQAIALKKFKL